MIRLNLIRPHGLRVIRHQVLCTVPAVCSEFVTNLANDLSTKGFAVSGTVPKNPLRTICSRFPHFEPFYSDGTIKLTWFLDTLDCGHQIIVHALDCQAGQKRHRCAECAQLALALPEPEQFPSPKKPVQSVRHQRRERKAA